MSELITERVLRAVEQVPAGQVVSYGDLAELVGTSPRRVGAIMAGHGGEVSWWRVTDASGRLPPHLLPLGMSHWVRELTPIRRDRCAMPQARVDLAELAINYALATADLTG